MAFAAVESSAPSLLPFSQEPGARECRRRGLVMQSRSIFAPSIPAIREIGARERKSRAGAMLFTVRIQAEYII